MLTRPVLRSILTAVPAGATQLVPAVGEGTGAAACPPLLSPAAPWPAAFAAVRRTATHSATNIRHKLFSCICPPLQMDFFPTPSLCDWATASYLLPGADCRHTFHRYPCGALGKFCNAPRKVSKIGRAHV